VPLSLTILLVGAAVVLLAFGIGSTGGAIRFLTGGAALLVAVAATAATIGLFWLGQKNHWSSDGPGMLFVIIALVVCAIVAAVGWMFVLGGAATAAAPGPALADAPRDVKRVLRLLGFALLAIAGAGRLIAAYIGRGRAAHAAAVVAVSFATGRPRLLTLDAGGTIVDWDLHSRRESGRETVPELAGATALFLDATAEHGFAIAKGRAVHFRPLGRAAVETIPDARYIAGSGAVVIARDRSLLFVSYSDWKKPPFHELAWPQAITAIAGGSDFVAVADHASISLLDGRPRFVRTLASVPAPAAIRALEVLRDGLVVALDGNGAAWVIDVQRGVTRPVAAQVSLVAGARHVFLFSGGVVSEYEPRKNAATHLAKIGSGARAIDAWADHVAFGFADGEVLLGTRTDAGLETERLTVKPSSP
jgi:hypothetical protein